MEAILNMLHIPHIEPQTWESGIFASFEAFSLTYFDIGPWELEIRYANA